MGNSIWEYKTSGWFGDLVIGADGILTGYGGGLGNKLLLLAHEGGRNCWTSLAEELHNERH